MKDALRAVVSGLMLALMLAVIAVLAAVSALLLGTGLVVAFKAGGAWAAGASVVVGSAVVAVGLFERRRRQKRRAGLGVPISNREQPLFWVEIYRVAEGLGTRAPDELRLFADATAVACERRTWLGLRPGARSLHLGLPLLTGLTERELRVVVAHAFTRSWGPLSFARILQRGRELIGRVVGVVGETSVVARIVGRYGRAYLAVSTPLISGHELATDRLCADLAGNNAAGAALGEQDVLSRGWAAFVDGYAAPAAGVGRLPQGIIDGFSSFLREPGRRTQLADQAAGPAWQPPGTYASQLTLGDRLNAIASLPADAMHDTSGPALGLMRHPDHVIRRVEESMFREPGLVPGTWEEIVPAAAAAAARQDALQLALLGHQGGLGTRLSVANLLELMSFGLVDEMVRPMLTAGTLGTAGAAGASGASGDVEREIAGRLVTAFFATAAIESGTASYEFSWAAPRQLVDNQGAVDNLPALVDAALAEGNDVAALRVWLTGHKVGPELELGPEVLPAALDSPAVSPVDSQDGSPDGSPDGSIAEDPAEDRHPALASKSSTSQTAST